MVVYGTIIVLKRGGGDGSRFPITTPTCTFGRDPSCDIRITLATVAQEHCKLEVNKNGQVTLSDVSNLNQTLLNGISVKKNAILSHNDVISVADRKFRWECAPSSDKIAKSLILKQNFRFKADSVTPVGIVTPTRRDASSRDLSLSKSARKAVNREEDVRGPGSNKRSKISRRASMPSYYGDPVLTPTFSVSRQRRSKSNSSVNLADSSLEESITINEGSVSKNIRSSGKEAEKPAANKRSRSQTDKRIKMRKLDDENTIKIIAPSSPDYKKSAALRTIHGSKIAVGKKKDKKLMLVNNYRQKKKYMVQRSEKVKQAILKLNKTQSLAKNDTLKLVTANQVKKPQKGVSTPASKLSDQLNDSVNLTNMFVSPLQTPKDQSVSFHMKKLISSMDRKKRGSLMKSPDLSDLSSMFKTPELKSSPRKSLRNSQTSPEVTPTSKISPAKKNISQLKLSSSEESFSNSPKAQMSLRKSVVSCAASLRKFFAASPKLLKSPQSEASSRDSPKTPLTRKSSGQRAISARKSSQSEGSSKNSPKTPLTRKSSELRAISARKSPQTETSSSITPKAQLLRKSLRNSTISHVTPRKSISKVILKSPTKNISPLKSPQSEVSYSISPTAQTSRKSLRKSDRSFSGSPRQSFARGSTANLTSPTKNNSPLKSPQSEISSYESPKPQTSRKSLRNSSVSPRKSPIKAVSPLKSQSEVSSNESPKAQTSRKSFRKLAISYAVSPRKSFPLLSRAGSKSPTKAISPLKSPQSEVSSSESTKAQASRKSIRKSAVSHAVSPRKSFSRLSKAGSKSPTKNISLLKTPQSEVSSNESPKAQTSRKSFRKSAISYAVSPRKSFPLLSRAGSKSPTKAISPLKSPQSEVSSSESTKVQTSRKSIRKSAVSHAVSPRKSIARLSRANSKSPNKNISLLKSPQSEVSSSESPQVQTSRKSTRKSAMYVASPRKSVTRHSKAGSKSPIKNFSPEFSFSKSPIARKSLRNSSTLQADSPSKFLNKSLQSEISFSDTPKTPFTSKSNISQRSSRRNSSVVSESSSPFKTPRSAVALNVSPKILKSRKSSVSSSVSPRKSLSNSATAAKRNPLLRSQKVEAPSSARRSSANASAATSPSQRKSVSDSPAKEVISDPKLPNISASSFYSPKKTPNRTSSDFILQLSDTRSSLRSSILIKSPDRSPSKLSPRKSLSYATNEILLKNSPVPENAISSTTRSSNKSVSPTTRRLSSTKQTEVVVKKLSLTPSPAKCKTNSPSPKKAISAQKSPNDSFAERRSSRKISHSNSPIKFPRRSESVSPKRSSLPIKSPRPSRSVSPAKSPEKIRKSRSSSSPEKVETSPVKRTSLRASSKLNLRAVVKIGKRSAAKGSKAVRTTPQADFSNVEGMKELFQKSPSVEKVDTRKQKKKAAKLSASIISKAKRRSLTSINKSTNAKSRQRGAKKLIASPNLSGLHELFMEDKDGDPSSATVKRSSPSTKVAGTSPRRLRVRSATPLYSVPSIKSRQKKQIAESKVTPQATPSSRGRTKSPIKRKFILESLNTSTESDIQPNQKQDYYFPEGLKVQWKSPSKSPSPTKVQSTSQRRASKRGAKTALTLKVDLSPIKESPRKRTKTSKVVQAEQEKPEESITPKTPKRQTRAKKESLAASPTEVPKTKTRGNKSKKEASPVKETTRNIKRKKTRQDEPEVSTAKSPSKRQKAKKDDQNSPTKSREVKSVRASARLKNK